MWVMQMSKNSPTSSPRGWQATRWVPCHSPSSTSSQRLLLVAEVARVAPRWVGALPRVWRESRRGVLGSRPGTNNVGTWTTHGRLAKAPGRRLPYRRLGQRSSRGTAGSQYLRVRLRWGWARCLARVQWGSLQDELHVVAVLPPFSKHLQAIFLVCEKAKPRKKFARLLSTSLSFM